MGLMHEPDTGKLVSMCKPGMPCKEFNKFLVNGSLATHARDCGVAVELYKAVLSKDWLTVGIEGAFQNHATR